MYIYSCQNTRREPFTTTGRPPPQGGHIQSSYTSLLSTFLSLQNFLSIQKLKIAFTEIKRKTCTETRQLSNEQPLWLPQSFFCKQRGKSFKVCCRHRTAGLGSLKSDLLHHYPHMRGNISQVIGTPFHIFVPSGPIDG